MPKSITTLWNSLLKMQWGVIIIASVLIVVIEGAIVIMRYFLKADLFGIEEIIVIPAFFLYFIGASVGTHDKKHITAELVSEFVNNEIIKRSIKLISSFITTAVCLVIFYWSLEFFIWSLSSGKSSSTWEIPEYVKHSSLFFGFLFMSLYLIIDFIKDIKSYIKLVKK